jgi:apolipoprotein N-acyltransferase
MMNDRIRFFLGILLSALSGVMLLLSFPPYGIWWLAWLGFVPAIFAQYRMMPQKQSSLAPAIYALVWLGPYLARLFGTQFGPFFTYLGVLIAILVYFANRERVFIERTQYRWMVLQGVAAWVGSEMVRASFIPVIATSAFIGYTQATQAWLIQPVTIFSIYGLNIMIMVVNFVLAQGAIAFYDSRQPANKDAYRVNPLLARNWAIAGGILVAAWISTSLIIYRQAPQNPEIIRVASLRANFDLPAHRDQVNAAEVRFNKFKEQAYQAASQGAQVLITSEMAFNFDPQVDYTKEFQAIAADTDTYIFIGYSVLNDQDPRENSVVLLSPEGKFSEVYHKTHIPPGEAYDKPGGQYPVFDTRYGKMASLVCHDANYTDVTRHLTQNGAQLIAAPFFEFPGFGEQLWQNVTFRAVENHTSMVVTGSTSASAIIDPYGNIKALDTDKAGSELVLVGDVSLGNGKGTLYTSLGDILGWASLAGMVLFIVFQSLMERRAKKDSLE